MPEKSRPSEHLVCLGFLGARVSPFAMLLLALGCSPRHIDLTGTYGIRDLPATEISSDDHLRILVVGDIGERLDPGPYRAQGFPKGERLRTPHPAQSTIAASSNKACGDSGCDLALILGDNIYPHGVAKGRRGKDDKQLLERAITGYKASMSLVVLGNHDWGPAFPSRRRAERELDIIEEHPDWMGGTFFYSVDVNQVRFIGLDTNSMVRRARDTDDPKLQAWIDDRLATDQWTVVMGHHPLRSRSRHGDVGSYRDFGRKFWQGKTFAAWTERNIVGRADFYLSGHDHNLQFYELAGEHPTAAIVSGSAAECAHPPTRDQSQPDLPRFLRNGHGFAILDLTPEEATMTFFDALGQTVYEARRERDGGWSYPDGDKVDPTYRCQQDVDAMMKQQAASKP